MAREYSNKRSSRARSRAPNQFLVVTVTFLLGYFAATVCDIETLSNWVSTQVLAHHGTKKPAPASTEQKQAATPPKPKFEFYTLLANEKVPNSGRAAATQAAATNSQTAAVNTAAVNAVKATTQKPQAVKVTEAKPVTTAPVTMPSASAGRGAYSVQVASFKARQDAEHMKGVLTLRGFSVYVMPINHATRGVWYRVVVGPYANRNLAQKAQMDLARNERLRGMITAG